MGYARILGGGEDGRYSIELDYGEATRQALLTSITSVIASIDAALFQVSALIAAADAKEAELVALVDAARDALIAATGPGSPKPDTAVFKFAVKNLTDLKARNEPLRIRKASLLHQRSIAVLRYSTWAAFNPVETRDAWCTDLTEGGVADSYVATVDIPGESSLILLAPGCRPWAAGDGLLTAREIMSPEQAFLNAAILPGWQKFKPTYRWGTITGIDYDADTADVSLFDQKSSAQRLSVNQASTLAAVPVEYMTCNALAFEIGDRVVVQFVGQDWASPKVIGFLDNPRPCAGWQIFLVGLSENGVSGPFRYMNAVFQAVANNIKVEEAIAAATSVDVDFRINRGAWIVPEGSTAGPIVGARSWQNPLGVYGGIVGGLVITFVPPGSIPVDNGQSFTSSTGAPAHFRVSHFINSGFAADGFNAPFYPLNSIIEVRLRLDGLVYVNLAVKSNFAPFEIDSGLRIPDAVTNVTQLDYVRFLEDGT